MRKIHPYIFEYLNGKNVNCNEIIRNMLFSETVTEEFIHSEDYIEGYRSAVNVLIKRLLLINDMHPDTVLQLKIFLEKDE